MVRFCSIQYSTTPVPAEVCAARVPFLMKFVRLFLGLIAISSVIPSLKGSVPDTLTLEDLQGHPERWPRTLPLPEEFTSNRGWKLAKGKSMIFVELKGDIMALETNGETHLELPVAGSALVAEANKLWAKLTPAQRALDSESLSADPSLWPERVAVVERLDVSNEWGQIEAGTEFALLTFGPDGVQIGRADLPQHPVLVDARSTDLFDRARARVLLPADQRPSRIVAALNNLLVDAQGRPVNDNAKLNGAQLFAFYFGAGWCGPCRRFSPGLVKELTPLLGLNPDLAVVYLSNDKTPAAMQAYMQEVGMPWAGVRYESWSKVPLLMSYSGGTVPQLLVLDRHGRILANSFRGDRYVGPEPVKRLLLKNLKQAPASP